MRLSSVLIAIAVLIAVALFVFRNSFGGDAPVEVVEDTEAEVFPGSGNVIKMKDAEFDAFQEAMANEA